MVQHPEQTNGDDTMTTDPAGGVHGLDRFTRAQTKAHKLGFDLRNANNASDGKRYTLVRYGKETHFEALDEVCAEIKRVKP
jgi:hypothetical protein